jgi:hypothetical protein
MREAETDRCEADSESSKGSESSKEGALLKEQQPRVVSCSGNRVSLVTSILAVFLAKDFTANTRDGAPAMDQLHTYSSLYMF